MISHIALSEMPMARALLKLAELPEPPDFGEAPQGEAQSSEPAIKHPVLHGLKSVALPALAFTGGTALGYGAQLGAEKLLKLRPSSASPFLGRYVAPVAAGLGALGYQQYKLREQKELHRAVEAHHNQSQRAVPAK